MDITATKTYVANIEETKELANYYKCVARISQWRDPDHFTRAGHWICYFEKDTCANQHFANRIVFIGRPQTIEPPLNPDQFDYSSFLKRKGIYFQVFISSGEWHAVAKNSGNATATGKLQSFRAYIIATFEKYIHAADALALIKALTLGDKDELSRETLDSFSNTGARHILTVSGMHVGILMVIWTRFLNIVGFRRKKLRFIKLSLTLMVIWAYAMITGAQPAVLRASFMLSLYVFSQLFKGNNHSLNALFLSALILLIYNPDFIFQLSFVFSYSAMLSILLFFPLFQRNFKRRNLFFDSFWQLLTLSFAAQALVLPLSVYYFHKIPLLFPVSALIATPGAFILFFLALILLATSGTSWLAMWVGKILTGVASAFLKCIGYLDTLPFGTLEGITINPIELMLLLLFASIVYTYFNKPGKLLIYLLMLVASVFLFLRMERVKNLISTRELCVYADPKHTLIDIFFGRTCISWLPANEDEEPGGFVFLGHRSKKRIDHHHRLGYPEQSHQSVRNFLSVKLDTMEMYVLTNRTLHAVFPEQMDFLVVDVNDPENINTVLENSRIGQLILTMRVKPKTIKKLARAPETSVWNIAIRGAYILEW